MKKRLLTALLSMPVVLAGFLPATSAQESEDGFNKIFETLWQRCNRATELIYRSRQLTTPDGNTDVYVESLLRKIVAPNSPLRRLDSAEGCYPDTRETVTRTLVFDRAGETRQIVMEPYTEAYVTYQPLSFSEDGRYLVANVGFAYTGGDGGGSVSVFDLENGLDVTPTNLCQDYYFAQYVGFISPVEFTVQCLSYGSGDGQFEAVNVQSGTIRTLATRPSALREFGTTAGSVEVLKTQFFD